MMRRAVLSMGLVLLATGCGSPGSDGAAEQETVNPVAEATMITGTVWYRERMALPPDAEIRIRLEDVSRQDAPSLVVAETAFLSEGRQVPIAFELSFDASVIDARMRYSVRAEIWMDGARRFLSTSTHPVITRGAPSQVEILVEQIGGASREAPDPVAVYEFAGGAEGGAFLGLFTYMADAALFRPCGSDAGMPVQGPGYLALERAYLDARTEPGSYELVVITGSVEERPPMEGEGTRPTLIVKELLGIFPGIHCPEMPSRPESGRTESGVEP
jgi:putative lipoprotein